MWGRTLRSMMDRGGIALLMRLFLTHKPSNLQYGADQFLSHDVWNTAITPSREMGPTARRSNIKEAG